ncbi:MAG TPA: Ppx/GppA phosphatase family protein [Polyangiaceae bacterium]|jgi:exopolyphosphatase/guanosine-5'-triphosphate,3'-diphosphate pyrophosphatase|nr:Ppx/GppA phosphatase family protein [Polyangiaceae bacterium]
MRVATIDIGTNSVLLLVAEAKGGALQPLVERATITRLGQGVDRTRCLSAEASERTLACLSEYARVLREHSIERLDVVGTSAMRDANGGEAFVLRAREILGVAPRVIDGTEEARLTFIGALSGLAVSRNVTVFDIGGGSTEIVTGQLNQTGAHIRSAISLDIGSVRLFERHVRSDPPRAEEMQRVEQDIHEALAQAPEFEPNTTLIGVAGTVTQLAALELELSPYDAARVHGSELTREVVERLSLRLASLDLNTRRTLPGMEPSRADVIIVGSAIARAMLSWSGASKLLVSDRGVRWGLAIELAGASGSGVSG